MYRFAWLLLAVTVAISLGGCVVAPPLPTTSGQPGSESGIATKVAEAVQGTLVAESIDATLTAIASTGSVPATPKPEEASQQPAGNATPIPPTSPPPTPTEETGREITGDTCVEGICLEVTAVSWFLEFVEGDPGPAGMDTCQPRADYTADFAVQLTARNNSGDSVLLQYEDHDFRLVDNTGRRFQLMDFNCSAGIFSQRSYHPGSYKTMFEPGQELALGPTYVWQSGPPGVLGSGTSTTQLLGYKGDIRPETEYVILYVEDFSRIPYAAWKFEVPR